MLCANAGIFPQAKLEELSPETWDEVLNTNLTGTFLAVKACVPYLKNSSQGRIIITCVQIERLRKPVRGGVRRFSQAANGERGISETAAGVERGQCVVQHLACALVIEAGSFVSARRRGIRSLRRETWQSPGW